MQIISSKLLENSSDILHGFGVRGIGVGAYLDEMGIKDRFVFETNQIHGDVIHCLMRPKKGKKLEGDAFVTDRPGIVCFVRTADCVPILMSDKEKGVVAAIHSGWRGTAENIAGKTVKAMENAFDSSPGDIIAAIGPRICAKCYDVGGEVTQRLENLNIGDEWRADPKRIDLGIANTELLLRAGVAPENIDVLPHCTFCDKTFASYRRDRSETERQFNFIMIGIGDKG